MQKIFFSKIKIIFIFFLLFSFTVVESQNLISVPFTNGFVGDNTANNQSTNAYYLSTRHLQIIYKLKNLK
jgi:hypothetical protein